MPATLHCLQPSGPPDDTRRYLGSSGLWRNEICLYRNMQQSNGPARAGPCATLRVRPHLLMRARGALSLPHPCILSERPACGLAGGSSALVRTHFFSGTPVPRPAGTGPTRSRPHFNSPLQTWPLQTSNVSTALHRYFFPPFSFVPFHLPTRPPSLLGLVRLAVCPDYFTMPRPYILYLAFSASESSQEASSARSLSKYLRFVMHARMAHGMLVPVRSKQTN